MRSIIPIILICASIAGFIFYVMPMYSEVNTLRTDVASYDQALSNSKDLQETRDNLIASYKVIPKEDKDRLNRFLPNTVNNIELILEIQHIASKHNLSIKNISFVPPTAESAESPETTKTTKNTKSQSASNFGTFDLDFKTRSDYATFKLFMADLEQNLRLIDIVSVSFTVPEATIKDPTFDPNLYDFSLKIKTYWLKH